MTTLLVATAAAVLRDRGSDAPTALVPLDGDSMVGLDDARAGTVYVFGLDGFTNDGPHRVQFRDVLPVNPPDGLDILSIQAVDNCTEPQTTILLGSESDPDPSIKPLRLHDVTAAVVEPHSRSCWYFLVRVRPTRPGTFRIDAFDVRYTAAGKTITHRHTSGLQLTVPAATATPASVTAS